MLPLCLDNVCNDVLVSVLPFGTYADIEVQMENTLIYHCAVHVLFVRYFILQQKQRVVSIHRVRRILIVTNVPAATKCISFHLISPHCTEANRIRNMGE